MSTPKKKTTKKHPVTRKTSVTHRKSKAAKAKRSSLVRLRLALILCIAVLGALVLGVFWHTTKTDASKNATPTTNTSAKPVTKIKRLYPEATVLRDIPYCNGQGLDIYFPMKYKYEKSPVLIYMHGGGWIINNKSAERDRLKMLQPLRSDGFVIVSIDYRKMPVAYYPAPLQDALCSIRFLRANATKYGLDEDKFAGFGFSAGGYMTAMAGVLDQNEEDKFGSDAYSKYSSHLQVVVTLAGLVDFEDGLWQSNHVKIARFLHGGDIAEANPARYVSAKDAAFLLIHGEKDQFVPVMQDDAFARSLEEAGVPHEIFRVKNADHGLNPTGGEPNPSRDETTQKIRSFIKQYLLQE